MAEWKLNAITDLRDYPYIVQSLQSIPAQIKELEAALVTQRSVQYDKTPVQGGISGAEDRILNNIDRRERLKINLSVATAKVERIENGLNALTATERKVLDAFYINRISGHMRRLCADLNYEERNIYKIKDTALRKFTLAMFGLMDF